MAVDTQAPPRLGTIVHYEIGAKDASKLVTFYGGVFGWTFAGAPGMEDYNMADTGGDSMVAIYNSEEPRLTNYISVNDVKAYVGKITAHGGTVIHEFTVPYMGYGAVALDPEQNPIGIWQADSGARES
jgi:uncharacterized protein